MKQENKILENQKVIGYRKYQALKTYDFENMSADQMVQFRKERKMSVAEAEKQIELYEAKHELTPEQKEKQETYFKNLQQPKKQEAKKLTPELLYKAFVFHYQRIFGKQYNIQKGSDSLENLKTLIFYFTRDQRFFTQKNVIEKVKVGNEIKISKPSFSKGFIIVGSYGTGKTSSMSVFEYVFRDFRQKGYDTPIFKKYTSQNITEMYESVKTPLEKKSFWETMKRGRLFFDDLKSEEKASNYGIKNIMREVIEKREYMIDFISCNYSDKKPGDISEALIEIGENYGSRVFDRIFSKWNIIEFKGKSYRGK